MVISANALLAIISYVFVVRSWRLLKKTFLSEWESLRKELWEKVNNETVCQQSDIDVETRIDLDAVLEVSHRRLANLKWEKVGSEKPSPGTEIMNEALRKQLEETLQEKVEFTKKEWEHRKIDVSTIPHDSYVKLVSGDMHLPVSIPGILIEAGFQEARGADMIEEALRLYRLLIERRISIFQMRDRVIKVWPFSWTAFLFTIYPALLLLQSQASTVQTRKGGA